MNRLDSLHYLPVIAKRLPGRVMLYDPRYTSDWALNLSFLKLLAIPKLKRPYLENFYFNQLSTSPDIQEVPLSSFEIETMLCHFSLEAISFPAKVIESEYNELLQDSYLTVTEKFISRHVLGHVASSRHLLLYNIQLKGVGKTATTHQLSLPNLNGYVHPFEAVRTYINGKMLECSLPFGTARIQAILLQPQSKLTSCVVVRDAHSHRLAQIEPGFLNAKDQSVLLAELNSQFGDLSNHDILERIFEQHVCLWVMGIEHPMNPDNLSLSGFPMDEEDMRPGHAMDGMILDFDIFFFSEPEQLISTLNELREQKFHVRVSINFRFSNLMKWYSECLNWIRPQLAEEFPLTKSHSLRRILRRFFEPEALEVFIQKFERFESELQMDQDQFLQYIDQEILSGATITITDQKMQFRKTSVKVKYTLPTLGDLRSQFNQLGRSPLEMLINRITQLEIIDNRTDNSSAMSMSHQLHKIINRQTFSLAEPLELTVESSLSYIKSLAVPFNVLHVTVFARGAFQKISLDQWSEKFMNLKEVILVDIEILYGDKPLALTAPKMPLKLV